MKSRTLWFSAALAVLGVVETQFALVEMLVPEKYRGLVFVAIGCAVAYLRWVTTQPLSERK